MIPNHEADVVELPDLATVEAILTDVRIRVDGFASLEARYGHAGLALRHLGLAQRQAGALAPALLVFKAALRLRPHDNDLWRDLGAAFDAAADPEAATRCLRRAIEIAPQDWRALTLLANLESRLGRLDEAAAGFTASLALEPNQGDAHFGLALVHFARRAFDQAIVNMQAALALGSPPASCLLALGRLHYVVGAFAASREAFEAAAQLTAIPEEARQAYQRARALTRMIAGDVEAAVDDYAAATGESGAALNVSVGALFSLLSGFGHAEAARTLGNLILARNPADEGQRYLNAVLSGERLSRAPAVYVESHFDAFADTFDEKLVTVLGYEVPERLSTLLLGQRASFGDALDLGCGTGLAAPHLAPHCRTLTGVDLSSGMLERARARGVYTDLIKADVLDVLAGSDSPYDLVFAADLLIYLGDLAALFADVARRLAPNGCFALSLETTTDGTYVTLPSGRFAHSLAYIRTLAAADFVWEADRPCVIRLEANSPVEGALVILRRR